MNRSRQVVRRATAVLERRVGDEVLLTVPSSQDITALQQTSTVVWDLLSASRTTADLTAEVAKLYHLDEGAIAAGVEALLEMLQQRRLVEVSEESDAP